MLLIAVLTTLAVAPLAKCKPVDFLDNHSASMALGRHVTAGISTRNNSHPYIRYEVRDLKNKFPEQWNLYILGLRAFQNMDQSDPLSSYRILGIHGRPYEVWQDASGVENPGIGGYCPHSSMLFSTWHRPYLALFEQELYKQVLAIAEQASIFNRQRWLVAANSFRIPYFDTAYGGELPDFLTNPSIQVIEPDGGTNVIPNPLYQYEFHPVSQHDFDGKWAQMNATVRWPTTNDASGQSQPEKFRRRFYAYRRLYRNEVGKVLRASSFNEFAGALELFHGWLHSDAGGIAGQDAFMGHFSPVEYSAFDPIFMLHHANVDRLVAIYQALYPNTWFEPTISENGNFWIPNNVTVDANWPLKPFWKDDQSFYSSNDVRNTTVLGYAYPETQSWAWSSEDEWRKSVRSIVAQKYGSSTRLALTETDSTSSGALTHLLVNSTFTDWNIVITASTFYLPGTFRVLFSLLTESLEPLADENPPIVGQWMQLMPMGTNAGWKTHDAESKKQSDTAHQKTTKSSILLTPSLLDQVKAGQLASLEAPDVVPYLQKNLAWRVTGENGVLLEVEDLDAFIVDVVSTRVHIPEDPAEMLEYDDEVTQHPEVTRFSHESIAPGKPYCVWAFCATS